MTTKNLCLASVFTAIVCLVTRFIQIPIPLGYFNIGNCIILLFCYVMPCPYGLFIGGVGSAIADLLSMPVWAFPTLIIKVLMPLAFYGLIKLFDNHTSKSDPGYYGNWEEYQVLSISLESIYNCIEE